MSALDDIEVTALPHALTVTCRACGLDTLNTPANHGPLTVAELLLEAAAHECDPDPEHDDRSDELDEEGRRDDAR